MVLAKFQMLSSYVWLITAVLNLVTLSKQPVRAFGYPLYRKSVCLFLRHFQDITIGLNCGSSKILFIYFFIHFTDKKCREKIKPTNQLTDKKDFSLKIWWGNKEFCHVEMILVRLFIFYLKAKFLPTAI